jgi:hypothetical protein
MNVFVDHDLPQLAPVICNIGVKSSHKLYSYINHNNIIGSVVV